MNLATYRDLRAQARRLVRCTADVDDLVQDAMLAAVQAGRDDVPWLIGVMRNLAAMEARGASRRRRREQVAGTVDTPSQASALDTTAAVLPRLPPSARRVAVMALHGLTAEEIRWILRLSPTAFRQRLSVIRRALGALPPAQRAEALALAYVRDPARSVDLQFGLLRRALKAALRGAPGLATHDADGHLLVLRTGAHTLPPGGNTQVTPTRKEQSHA